MSNSASQSAPQTLYDKIWNTHVISQNSDGDALIFIDRHLVHEVTSPQAFEGLRLASRIVRDPGRTLAVADHNVSTDPSPEVEPDPESLRQLNALDTNCKEFEVKMFGPGDARQGIVHLIGPEQGFTLPGTTIVCGDSHTSTHGAFGALAQGIGTSEVEHVLATQTLRQKKARNMRVFLSGKTPEYVTAKDLILAIIGHIGTAGGTGHVIEYAGDPVTALTMSGRMTLCNMSIEAGARAGMIAPDPTCYSFLEGRPMAPEGVLWDRARRYWDQLPSDEGASFDQEVNMDVSDLPPLVTWGTSPENVVSIEGTVPDPDSVEDPARRLSMINSLEYMGLKSGVRMTDIPIDRVFIGSCTNGRIEDLRAAARLVKGQRVHQRVSAMVVPGSGQVKTEAEAEGLDKIFTDAGFEWRLPGCSMCLAMNADRLQPEERCASTSNRNFEGRQGYQGRTHLLSPAMAAAAAIAGKFVDIRQWSGG